MVKLPRGERLRKWWDKVPTPKEVLIERPKDAIKRKLWSMVPVRTIVLAGGGLILAIILVSAAINGCMIRWMSW